LASLKPSFLSDGDESGSKIAPHRSELSKSNRHSAHRHIELIFLDLFFSDLVKQNNKPLKNALLWR
jgi:hypothetical protein